MRQAKPQSPELLGINLLHLDFKHPIWLDIRRWQITSNIEFGLRHISEGDFKFQRLICFKLFLVGAQSKFGYGASLHLGGPGHCDQKQTNKVSYQNNPS